MNDPTASIILIGNELLNGKVRDTNGPYLLDRLRKKGVRIGSCHTVGDEVSRIAELVKLESVRNSWVFTSGGVGPTHDDVTMEGICEAFGVELVYNDGVRSLIEEHFKDRNLEAWMKLAYVPDLCKLIYSKGARFPVIQMKNVYVLPGIPEIFKLQFNSIEDRFESSPFHHRAIYFTLAEGVLAGPLALGAKTFPEVLLGSYPTFVQEDYKVRVTLESRSRENLSRAFKWLIDQFPPSDIYKVSDD